MPQARNIDIAEVLRDAQLGDLRTLAEERMAYDQLHAATEALFNLLEARRIDYVLVGGLAVLQYVEGRNTRDIDLILAPEDLDRLPELQVSSRDADFAPASIEGVQVDVLLTSNKVFDIVRAKYATVQDFGGRDIRCATPEGLVLLKLFALPSLYRQGDFGRVLLFEGDVDRLIYERGLDPVAVVGLAAEELGRDSDDMMEHALESLTRIRRFEERCAAFAAADAAALR